MNRAVFLDRDGVLVEDRGLIVRAAEMSLLPGVPEGLLLLSALGFKLIVVTNQTVVARGLLDEDGVSAVSEALQRLLVERGGKAVDGVYFCPHHPNATLAEYRLDCSCRKPRPGLLLRASQEQKIDLSASFMVGDRLSDVIAGARAGCRTVLVETGRHVDPPIETAEPMDLEFRPDHRCADLIAAARWIAEVATA